MYGEDDCQEGRLDLVVLLHGCETPLWIEAKIDAPLTRRLREGTWIDQLEVYLEHQRLTNPKPVLLTLTRTGSLRRDVTGISWDALAATVDGIPDANRWWKDLAEFLYAEGVAFHRLSADPMDYEALLLAFWEVNEKIKQLWSTAPTPLYWKGKAGLDGFARRAYKKEHRLIMTGGPLRYGVQPDGGAWTWVVAVAAGSEFHKVPANVEGVLEAARLGGLTNTWVRSHDKNAVLSQRRPFVPGASLTDIVIWMSIALEELRDAGVVEPFMEMVRKLLESDADRSASTDGPPAESA